MSKYIGHKLNFAKSIGQKHSFSTHMLGFKQMLSKNKKSDHIKNDISDGIINNSNNRDMIFEPNIKHNHVHTEPVYKSQPSIVKPKREHDNTNKKFL
jgi:hypothetical protein